MDHVKAMRNLRYGRVILLVAVCLILAIALATYRRIEMVDINSGRFKEVTCVCAYPVRSETQETWVSTNTSQSAAMDDWKVVNEFSLGSSISKHFRYHGALSQIQELQMLDRIIPFSADAKREVANSLLREWKTGDSFHAGEYIHLVSKAVGDKRETNG